ncbi:MAG: hypothetical protein U0797_17725 [Gemmataceae bacterium]
MTTVTIPLSEEKQARLRSLAERAGLSAEEFLRRRVEKLLEEPDDAFNEAVDHAASAARTLNCIAGWHDARPSKRC